MKTKQPGDKLSRRYFTSMFGLGVLAAATGVRLAEHITEEGAELARRMTKYAAKTIRHDYYGHIVVSVVADPERPAFVSWRVEGS